MTRWTITGAPGAGKTSLLRHLGGGTIDPIGPVAIDRLLTPPGPHLEASARVEPTMYPGPHVCVVDASRPVDEALPWLANAAVIAINHIDRCADLDLVEARLRAVRDVPVVRGSHGRVTLPDPSDLPPDPGAALPHWDACVVRAGFIDPERLERWLRMVHHTHRPVRIKGWLTVPGIERRWLVQGVHDALDVVPGPAWQAEARSVLVIVGPGLGHHDLQVGFESCAPCSVAHTLEQLERAVADIRAAVPDRQLELHERIAAVTDATVELARWIRQDDG